MHVVFISKGAPQAATINYAGKMAWITDWVEVRGTRFDVLGHWQLERLFGPRATLKL